MYLLLLAGFSNYNNRTIRKTTTPDLYSSLAESYWYITKDNQLLDINFKPNDGVTTTQVINSSLYSEFGHEPDYLIAFENADTSSPSIVSRWFVMEIRQNRGGQYELTLRRDLIADYYDDLKTADIFVERGRCSDDDPLIYNDEGVVLNKIKKSETLLKDELGIPWFVGYMSPTAQKSVDVSVGAPQGGFLTIAELSASTGIPEATLNKLFSGQQVQTMVGYWSYVFKYGYDDQTYGSGYAPDSIEGYLDQEVTSTKGYSVPNFGTNLSKSFDYYYNGTLSAQIARSTAWSIMGSALINQPSIKAALATAVGAESDWITSDQYYALLSVNRVIQYQGNYYDFTLSRGDPELKYPAKALVSSNATLASALSSVTATYPAEIRNIYQATAEFRAAGRFAYLTLSKTIHIENEVLVSVGGSGRNKVRNRPYQMFCIPADDIAVGIRGVESFWSRKDVAEVVVGALQQMSDIYDIQLLPYCPLRLVIENDHIQLAGLTANYDYDLITMNPHDPDNMEHAGVVIYPEVDSAEFAIIHELLIDTDKKFDSNAKMMRLTSPNYQGSFDFNVAKNNGVDAFTIRLTYKPFTPFIRVAPSFGGLYGQEYNDQRGLICGGNFSLTRIDDQWYTYQLNNKNYQNIFNREIQTLDLSQSLQMRDAIIGASVGTLQGGVAGAQTGQMAAGGWGAAAGAVLGAGASGLGGAIDVNTLARLQKDQRSLQVDKFNYALGNIKALPNTLTKVDAFDISSKIFPFIEEYGPTEEEKALFLERMRLQSYTLMRIEKLGNQMTEDAPTDISALHYVKGQLIRTNNEDLRVDSHQWDEIYAELSKGVYI